MNSARVSASSSTMPISTWSSAADSRVRGGVMLLLPGEGVDPFCRSRPVIAAVPAAVAASSSMRTRSEVS